MSRDQIVLSLNIPLIVQTAVWFGSRYRLVVRTLRCGRSNPGSNSGHGTKKLLLIRFKTKVICF